MKQNTKISCVLFTVLFVLQLLILGYIGANAAVTSLPVWVIAEFAMLFVFGGILVRFFVKGGFSCAGKKTLAVTAVLYLATMGVFYQVQISLILTFLSTLNPALGQNIVVAAVVMGAKVLLGIIAVYFAVAREKETEVAIEFETPIDASALETAEAAEKMMNQMDEKEVE